ncbi:MAG TPA: cytochrome c [Bryobacteraceae bacterium]|nr:cytochrome c [Bryobacteraceae bacterium]
MKKIVLTITAASAVMLFTEAGSAAPAQDAAAVYKRQCASCHGADGSGKTGPGKAFKLRDLRSAEVQKMTDEQMFDVLNKGKGKMPAYANLGHDTLHAMVKHIREMAKTK